MVRAQRDMSDNRRRERRVVQQRHGRQERRPRPSSWNFTMGSGGLDANALAASGL